MDGRLIADWPTEVPQEIAFSFDGVLEWACYRRTTTEYTLDGTVIHLTAVPPRGQRAA